MLKTRSWSLFVPPQLSHKRPLTTRPFAFYPIPVVTNEVRQCATQVAREEGNGALAGTADLSNSCMADWPARTKDHRRVSPAVTRTYPPTQSRLPTDKCNESSSTPVKAYLLPHVVDPRQSIGHIFAASHA